MKNNVILYQHKIPNGEVFYIGIGNTKRPYLKGHRNVLWHNIVFF